MNNLDSKTCEEIENSSGYEYQLKEWIKFGFLSDEDVSEFNLNQKRIDGEKLPIDTRFLER